MYEMMWRNKFLTLEAKTIDDMIEGLSAAVNDLKEMKAAGITLDEDGPTSDDYARLITDDPKVAEKFGLEKPEWDEEEDCNGCCGECDDEDACGV